MFELRLNSNFITRKRRREIWESSADKTAIPRFLSPPLLDVSGKKIIHQLLEKIGKIISL